MSILTDRQIAHLCNAPTHILYDRIGFPVRAIVPPYSEEEQRAIDNYSTNHGQQYGNKEEARPLQEAPEHWVPMIEPFCGTCVREVGGAKVPSFGISSMGYDVSLSDKELKLFSNIHTGTIDPLDIDIDKCFVDPIIHHDPVGRSYIVLPPNSYILGHTTEYFNIPRDVLVVCVGKSTYARAGITVNVTPIEPGFKGNVVLEIGNLTTLPAKVYLNCGISQFLFFQSSEPCDISYDDRSGKYQGQTGLTHAKG